jgi:hypothetical protein
MAEKQQTVMVPRHLRIKRAYQDPRPMDARGKEELVTLAHWQGINTKGKTKEDLARLLERGAGEVVGKGTRKAIIAAGDAPAGGNA